MLRFFLIFCHLLLPFFWYVRNLELNYISRFYMLYLIESVRPKRPNRNTVIVFFSFSTFFLLFLFLFFFCFFFLFFLSRKTKKINGFFVNVICQQRKLRGRFFLIFLDFLVKPKNNVPTKISSSPVNTFVPKFKV